MTTDSGGQAGAHQTGEIEITEEMIDAGADVLLELRADDFSDGQRARATFQAMMEAAEGRGQSL